MDIREIAIEPAATLDDAQRSLLQHQPRVLVFSGHTFMGSLAFENAAGRMDEHADANAMGEVLLGRRKTPESIPETLPPLKEQASGSHRSEPALAQSNSNRSGSGILPGILPGLMRGTSDKASEAPSAAEMAANAMAERLECVVLNGCKTEVTPPPFHG